jgi:hypothetical protein
MAAFEIDFYPIRYQWEGYEIERTGWYWRLVDDPKVLNGPYLTKQLAEEAAREG